MNDGVVEYPQERKKHLAISEKRPCKEFSILNVGNIIIYILG